MQDYGFRIYNPAIARFLSVDPLTREYPWNSTYAFAENTPIVAIDLDGLEGLKYDVNYHKNNGKSMIGKVIEFDIYIGIGKNSFSTNDLPLIEENLNVEFNGLNPKTGKFRHKKISGGKVFFQFNIKTFNNDQISADDYAKALRKSTAIETNSPVLDSQGNPVTNQATGEYNYRQSVVGVVLAKDSNIKGQGQTVTNRVLISSTATDASHTIAHELGHFLLMGSAKNPNTVQTHDQVGGLFKYGRIDKNTGQPIPGDGTLPLSTDNVKLFLENIPEKKPEPIPSPDQYKEY